MSTNTPDSNVIRMDREEALSWANKQRMLTMLLLALAFLTMVASYIATGIWRAGLMLDGILLVIFAVIDMQAKSGGGVCRRLLTPLYNHGRDTPFPWQAFELESQYNHEQ